MQTPTLIKDTELFVRNVLAVQDAYRIDDNLEELKYFAFTVLGNRMVKFSGLFPTEHAAIERAKKAGMEGIFTSAVGGVGKWCMFGNGMEHPVDKGVHAFVEALNAETNRFQKRIRRANKASRQAEKPPPSSSSTDLVDAVPESESESEPEPEPEPEPKPQEPAPLDDQVFRRTKMAVQRGDPKDFRMSDQRFVVVGHGRIADDSCLFRVVGAYETEEEAHRAAKKAFDADRTDPVVKRFDYAVARQYVWLSFPIDFAKDVQDTRVDSNPHLQDYYKGEMYKRSAEHKAAIDDIASATHHIREQNKQIEGAHQFGAADAPEIKSAAEDSDDV